MNSPSPDENVLITASDVTLGYGSQSLTTGLNLEAHRDHFWIVIGANGTGKSTLIKCLIGAQQPLAGSISRSAACTIGYVPQRLDCHATLPTTVREMLALALPRGAPSRRITESLAAVGLANREGYSFWRLSGGEMRRALVARALVRQPSILVLDEPAAGLDAHGELQAFELIADLHANHGIGIILVTHDLRLVHRYATHTALLDGDATAAGGKEEVLTDRALRAAFDLPDTWSLQS